MLSASCGSGAVSAEILDIRLVERGVYVVRPGPARVHSGIGTEDVVVGQQVGEAQLLDPLNVGTDRAAVGANLGLREHDAYIHD